MVGYKELQELVSFQAEKGALVLSLYLDTDLSRQPKEQCKLILRDKFREVAGKGINKDIQRVEQFLDYEYDWQGKGIVAFSCQKPDLWRVYSLAVPVRSLVFAAEKPYLQPLTDLLDEYEQYAVILVDREGARLFSVQLGEIQEEVEIYGGVIKRHKQGGWSQSTYQRHVDHQALHNLKMIAEAAEELCQREKCKSVVLAGSEEALAQFRDLLPKNVVKQIIGTIPADMTTPSAEILERSLEVFLAAKRKEESVLIEQMMTAAAKGELGAIGLSDTLYAIHQGRVHTLLVEQDYEQPGALCDQCGYVAAAQGQKCLFCGQEMRPVDNAVDLAIHKALEAGGTIRVVPNNEELAKAGHIGAILRY